MIRAMEISKEHELSTAWQRINDRREEMIEKGKSRYSYRAALATAQKLNWRIEDIIGGEKRLDFTNPGARQIIVGDVEFVQTSCGYAVPEMKFVSRRETLTRWAEAKGDEELVEYRRKHNRMSIDALEAPITDPSE